MTKSNFDKLTKQPMFARPPLPEEGAGRAGFGAVRVADGRSARRTGRTEQFATVVSPEFRDWIRKQAKVRDKTMAALLDDMKAAYIEKYGDD
jgi:hypothetical protein